MDKFDERGREIPDTTPVEMPANAKRPESIQDSIARMVALQLNQVAGQQGMPSFEEEDDFDDPTADVTEVGGEYYVTEASVEAIGAENDLEGSQGPLPTTGSGKGSTGNNSTDGVSGANTDPSNDDEAPKEQKQQ